MKYDSKKLEEHIGMAQDIVDFLHDHVVWEGQEGQSDHFDRLTKAERVALVGLYCDAISLRDQLLQYKHWFGKS